MTVEKEKTMDPLAFTAHIIIENRNESFTNYGKGTVMAKLEWDTALKEQKW